MCLYLFKIVSMLFHIGALISALMLIYLKKNTTWDNYYVFWESIENDIEYGWKNISNVLHILQSCFSCVNNSFFTMGTWYTLQHCNCTRLRQVCRGQFLRLEMSIQNIFLR